MTPHTLIHENNIRVKNFRFVENEQISIQKYYLYKKMSFDVGINY